MRHDLLVLLVSILVVVSASAARAQSVRLSAGLGVGAIQTQNEISESEGPLAQSYGVEFTLNSKSTLGAEHTRSLSISPLASSIAFTGAVYRWYLNSVPVPFFEMADQPVDQIGFRDLALFAGLGGGIAQSSLPPNLEGKSSNSAGVYVNPSFGADLQLGKSFGCRTDLNVYFMALGQGSIMGAALMGRVYFNY